MGQRLRGFAQPHVVGQTRAGSQFGSLGQPAKADFLVVPQLGLQCAGDGRTDPRGVAEAGENVLVVPVVVQLGDLDVLQRRQSQGGESEGVAFRLQQLLESVELLAQALVEPHEVALR